MSRPRTLLLAALAVALVQIGVLASMIGSRAAILRDGAEVALRIEPVDPRDLLRGDYVIMRYNISQIAGSLFAERPAYNNRGDQRAVYVRLAPDAEGIHQPVAARFDTTFEQPAGEGEVDIRGTASWWNDYDTSSPVSLKYGIERYYVPEGQGRDIEAGIGQRVFIVRVAVAAGGTAQIKSLHDGDRMLYEEPWY